MASNLTETLSFAQSQLDAVSERSRMSNIHYDNAIFEKVELRTAELSQNDTDAFSKIKALQASSKRYALLAGELESHDFGEEPVFSREEPRAPACNDSIETLAKLVDAVSAGDSCPLCLDGILRPSRIDDIKAERARYTDYLEELRAFRSDQQDYAAKKARWDFLKSNAESTLAEIGMSLKKIDSAAEVHCSTWSDFENHRHRFLHLLEEKKAEIALQLSALEPSKIAEEQRTLEDFLTQFNAWESTGRSRQATFDVFRSVVSDGPRLESIKKKLKAYKDQLVDARLQSIQEPVTRWWELLAPENIDFDLQFEVKDSKRDGVEIFCLPKMYSTASPASQRKKRKHAMGVLSDSQIDLLALAFNFATLQEELGQGLVWLDDPSDSLDGENITNFVKLVLPNLLKEGHQVVLCTHSREIVKLVWANYTEIVKSTKTGSYDQRFQQVSLDVQPIGDKNGSSSFGVVTSPFGLESAYSSFEVDFEEVKEEPGEKYRHGARLRLANSLRRAYEFYFSTLIDSVNPLVAPLSRKEFPAIQNQSATLGTYKDKSIEAIEVLLNDVRRSAGLFTDGQKTGIVYNLDQLLDMIASTNSRILNEGSHADTVIPLFSEIGDEWVRFKRLYNQLQSVPTQGSLSRYQLKHLSDFYPDGKHAGLFDKMYQSSSEATRLE